MLCDQWLRHGHLLCHLLQLLEALLELFSRGRVLCAGCNQLHRVQPRLLVQIVQQLNDLVKLVKVIDLNLALFELSERGQGSHS